MAALSLSLQPFCTNTFAGLSTFIPGWKLPSLPHVGFNASITRPEGSHFSASGTRSLIYFSRATSSDIVPAGRGRTTQSQETTMSQYAQPADPRGIEQFGMVASAPGLDYCISGAQPYSLDFAHSSDMICLVLGDLASQTTKAGTSQTKAHERMPVGAKTDRPAT
jgi:hypothetical protein